jgi:hypothetical protein
MENERRHVKGKKWGMRCIFNEFNPKNNLNENGLGEKVVWIYYGT